MRNMLVGCAILLAVTASTRGAEITSGARIIARIMDDCQKTEFGPCLKIKAINFFGRANRQREIHLGEIVTLVRDSEAPIREDIHAEELDESQPRTAEDGRDARLNSLLFRRIADFINSHKMMVTLPKLNPMEIQEGFEEGRGKMKKMMSMMMMGFTMKMAAVVPLVLGSLFLLAGKALVISKIALVLSLIIALKKLLQKQNYSHEVSWHNDGGWDRRSLSEAQNMAYRAHTPNTIMGLGKQ